MILAIDGNNVFHTFKHTWQVKPDFLKIKKFLAPYGATESGIYIAMPPSNRNPMAIKPLLDSAFTRAVVMVSDPAAQLMKRAGYVGELISDVINWSREYPQEEFTLVTGNTDYISLILELQERGHKVTLAAPPESCGHLLTHTANAYIPFGLEMALNK